ncbi:M3 family oligoendopeptidase [Geobacter pelophilus]|uniref:M3 family oligoendopeptidase n=1 Tax=Geoanaerobacter pelophilus TaxID=60036 RepID=A0AAW4KY70_9BACT|nr:M3 family oligoendopeptidase [Geoanaerobacter pelophilus]MBT0662852.1 M3 family oligoendopeptidase [Geoanaerobacter pelophilus]
MTDMLRWDTTRLYSSPDSPQLDRDFRKATTEAQAFRERYQGKVATLDAAGLLEALTSYEQLQETAVLPQLYGHLLFASDSEADSNKALMQRGMEFGNSLSCEVMFFDLELMAIPEADFAPLAADERLANYRHHLGAIRRFQPHALPEKEEQLLTQKNLTGIQAFAKLFDELTASLSYRMELDGEERDFTGEELISLLHHPEAAVRERALTVFLNGHAEQGIVLSTVFNTVALDHSQEMQLRSYSDPMQPTNLGNELSMEAVEHLMSVTEANFPLAQEYFRIKAKLLGMKRLKNTDVYAPVGECHKTYSFDQAKQLVLDSYSSFNPDYAPLIEGFFTERRIDVEPRQGKSGGAFCMGLTPKLPPYLLLNFTGNLRDVATLAHESGHGLHYLRSQEQTMVNYHAPLPLAETASVFGEMLLTSRMLAQETDREVKISLLCATIEDIIATTFRQVVLTRFEQRLHLERKDGLLSSDRLCTIWWEENAKLFGDSVEMIEAYRWGWSYISHFIHTRFYCYAYTFAELLVLSLYARYQETGPSFVPAFDSVLRSGGSRSPADTAALAGIDINDPGFWQKGYDMLGGLIAELKQQL